MMTTHIIHHNMQEKINKRNKDKVQCIINNQIKGNKKSKLQDHKQGDQSKVTNPIKGKKSTLKIERHKPN